MKYKLGRELPYAKVGNFVKITDEDLIFVDGDMPNGGCFFIGYEKDLDKLISEGWIKEIKPREFDLCFQEEIFCGISHNGSELWHNALSHHLCHIVKVVEVIE